MTPYGNFSVQGKGDPENSFGRGESLLPGVLFECGVPDGFTPLQIYEDFFNWGTFYVTTNGLYSATDMMAPNFATWVLRNHLGSWNNASVPFVTHGGTPVLFPYVTDGPIEDGTAMMFGYPIRVVEQYLTFNLNGGDSISDDTPVMFTNMFWAAASGVGAVYAGLPTATKAGYNFAGWSTQPNGGTWVANNAAVNLAADTTVYAQFTPKSYPNAVTLDSNGGWTLNQYVTATFGQPLPTHDMAVGPYVPELNGGYAFVGFFANNDGTGAQYYDSNMSSNGQTPWTTDGGGTVYAWYVAKNFQVTFDSNKGSPANTRNVTYDAPYGQPVSLPSTSRMGWNFMGWYLWTQQIDDDTIVKVAANHTLGAVWFKLGANLSSGSEVLGELDLPTNIAQDLMGGEDVEIVIKDDDGILHYVRGKLRVTPGGTFEIVLDDPLPPGSGTIVDIIIEPDRSPDEQTHITPNPGIPIQVEGVTVGGDTNDPVLLYTKIKNPQWVGRYTPAEGDGKPNGDRDVKITIYDPDTDTTYEYGGFVDGDGNIWVNGPIDDEIAGKPGLRITIEVDASSATGDTEVKPGPTFEAGGGETEDGDQIIGTLDPNDYDHPALTNGAPVVIVVDDGNGGTTEIPGHLEENENGGFDVVPDTPLPPGDYTIIEIIVKDDGGNDLHIDVGEKVPVEGVTVGDGTNGLTLYTKVKTPQWVGKYTPAKDDTDPNSGRTVKVTITDPITEFSDEYEGFVDDDGNVWVIGPIADEFAGKPDLTITVEVDDSQATGDVEVKVGPYIVINGNADIDDNVEVGTFIPAEGWGGDITRLFVKVKIAGKWYDAHLDVHGKVILDDPIDADLCGEDVEIEIVVEDPAIDDVSLAEAEGTIHINGDNWTWIRVDEIIAPPLTGNTDVLLAWKTDQITWYTPQFRTRGTIKYIVYTSPTLDIPVDDWTEQYEAASLMYKNVFIEVEGFDVLRGSFLWDQVRMLSSAQEPARFYKVKAVKVPN